MAKTPALSVLFPVRNGASHLETAVASLEAQSFNDFEVLVVDDGSQDSTPDIISRWAARDSRVRSFVTPRRGIARALDLALRSARAELVARMDADDVALPQRLEKQVRWLDGHPGHALVGSHVRIFPKAVLRDGMRRYERWLCELKTAQDIVANLFVDSPLCHPTVLARKEALLAVGGYRDVDGPEDYDLWLRLFSAGFLMANIAEVMLLWRERPGRATRVDRRYRPSAMMRTKMRYLRCHPMLRSKRVAIWGAGPWGGRWRKLLLQNGVETACFFDVDSKKVGRTKGGVPVMSYQEITGPVELPILVTVGAEGARERIRQELSRRGLRETEDYLCLQ